MQAPGFELPPPVDNTIPPSALHYPTDLVWTRSVGISAITPTIEGGAPTLFSIAPSLPAGITFDGTTGTIAGTPATIADEVTYEVTAENAKGSATTTFKARVAELPPAIAFDSAGFIFVTGKFTSTGAPENVGGPYTNCVKQGAFPAGLDVDVQTCAIFGTPLEPAARATYQVSASYADGSVVAAVDLTINPPLDIYPRTITVPTLPGLTQQFQAIGGLPPHAFSKVSGAGNVSGDGLYTVASSAGETVIHVRDAQNTVVTATIRARHNWTNGRINAFAHANDVVYFGGLFDRVNPFSTPRIALLDPSTAAPQLQFDVREGFDGRVESIALAGDYAYVGGSFTRYRGLPAPALAKVDLRTGELDTQFTQITGPIISRDGTRGVSRIAVDGSDVFIGGEIEGYRGVPTQGVLRLNATDGSLLQIYDAMCDGSCLIGALVIDGANLLVARQGVNHGAEIFHRINRQSGMADSAFTGTSHHVAGSADANAIAINSHSIYVAGTFKNYENDAVRDFIVRLSRSSGALETAFTPPFNSLDPIQLHALAATDTELYVGGKFGVITPDNNIFGRFALVKLSAQTGAPIEDGFNVGSGSLLDTVRVLALTPAGLYVGGDLDKYNGKDAGGFLLLDKVSGEPLSSFALGKGFSAGASSPGSDLSAPFDLVFTIAVDQTRLLVGGSFTAYQGTPAKNLASFSVAGSLFDASLGLDLGLTQEISALHARGGLLYVGGKECTGSTIPAGLMRVDPASASIDHDYSITDGGGLSEVNAFLDNVTSIFVGGRFTSVDDDAAGARPAAAIGGIVDINAETGLRNDLFRAGTSVTGGSATIHTLASVWRSSFNRELFAGGDFTTVNLCRFTSMLECSGATTRNNLFALDSTGALQGTNFGPNGPVRGVAVDDDPSHSSGTLDMALFAGGFDDFSLGFPLAVGGVVTVPVYDYSWLPQSFSVNGEVRALAFVPSLGALGGHTVFAGGTFSLVRDVPAQRLVRLIGSVVGSNHAPFYPDGDHSLDIRGWGILTLYPAGDLLFVGGAFTHYRGEAVFQAFAIDPVTGARIF